MEYWILTPSTGIENTGYLLPEYWNMEYWISGISTYSRVLEYGVLDTYSRILDREY
ncbi:hypothetical protein [Methanofervidicoccus sp. A16]|uniref:hypothetical protein n=1 Tax=Methanofervidicoccus sp. A16 TaxID=2607662 RepID=UPI001559D8BE|nr:hypothetical protein [Methanofervidicoccus sp. A16]